MSRSGDRRLYKVIFHNQGKVYEIFARLVAQGNLFGFIEAEDLVFGEKSQVLVDPGEESLRHEFAGVKRTYIPMHAVVRIDEVDQSQESRARVLPFPGERNVGADATGGRFSPYIPAPPDQQS